MRGRSNLGELHTVAPPGLGQAVGPGPGGGFRYLASTAWVRWYMPVDDGVQPVSVADTP
jgi:hypothetical protein